MTINRALHPRANAARLYLPRNEGGRGLRSAEETVRTEEHGLSDYIRCEEKRSNKLLKKLIKKKTKREYQENQTATKEKEWKKKALHGQYTKIANKTDRKKTYKWMKMDT